MEENFGCNKVSFPRLCHIYCYVGRCGCSIPCFSFDLVVGVGAPPSQSCPAIQVYSSEKLDKNLDRAARSFCSQEVELSPEDNTVWFEIRIRKMSGITSSLSLLSAVGSAVQDIPVVWEWFCALYSWSSQVRQGLGGHALLVFLQAWSASLGASFAGMFLVRDYVTVIRTSLPAIVIASLKAWT